jgi:hypothetical protein
LTSFRFDVFPIRRLSGSFDVFPIHLTSFRFDVFPIRRLSGSFDVFPVRSTSSRFTRRLSSIRSTSFRLARPLPDSFELFPTRLSSLPELELEVGRESSRGSTTSLRHLSASNCINEPGRELSAAKFRPAARADCGRSHLTTSRHKSSCERAPRRARPEAPRRARTTPTRTSCSVAELPRSSRAPRHAHTTPTRASCRIAVLPSSSRAPRRARTTPTRTSCHIAELPSCPSSGHVHMATELYVVKTSPSSSPTRFVARSRHVQELRQPGCPRRRRHRTAKSLSPATYFTIYVRALEPFFAPATKQQPPSASSEVSPCSGATGTGRTPRVFVNLFSQKSHDTSDPCWGSRSSEASPLSAHAENLRRAYGFGLARRPFAARALTKH